METTAPTPTKPTVDAAALLHLFERQQARSEALRTESVGQRAARLRQLKQWLTDNRPAIQQALYADFRKPTAETDVSEIWSSQVEIDHALKKLKGWMAPRRVSTPLSLLGTRAWVQYEPKGVCLLMAPWNYPFYLALEPLISALAAGNCCILKPSEITPRTAALLHRMADELFDPAVVAVVEGDKDVATALLKLPFNHIFFTGSPEIGKVVMRAAAEHLTSVTLELGGKSPAIVDATADLRDAAEKIVWGKGLNAGQTCVAPDYLLVDEKVQAELLREIDGAVRRLYRPGGAPVAQSASYARIVNRHHFDRLAGLLADARARGARVALGGETDAAQHFIEPTVLLDAPADSRVMQEEIFGPLLPVRPYKTLMEAADAVNARPRPLALYVFTQSAENQRYLLRKIPAGGAAVNDTIVHLTHPELPFGGVGNSGTGKAHGKYGFREFSNLKGVLRQRTGRTGIKTMYPPYSPRVKQLIDWLLRFL